MNDNRFLAGILSTVITCPLLIFSLEFKQDNTTIGTIIFLSSMYVWRLIYSSILKHFSRNKIKNQESIIAFTKKSADDNFVILLRPFNIDATTSKYPDTFVKPFNGTVFGSPYLTLEQEINDAFKLQGLKTIAIMDNKSDATKLGFERYTAENKDWQIHVTNLIKTSTYICLLGNGDGSFQWELNEIIKQNCQNKSLIFYPSSSKDIEAFLTTYKLFSIPTNYETGLFKSSVFGGLLFFNDDKQQFEKFPFKYYSNNSLKKSILEFLEKKYKN